MLVETRYIPTEAAKIRFEYTLYNAETREVVCTGASVQVFLDKEADILQLTVPAFFAEWKKSGAVIMTKVYLAAENIISPLGLTARANFERLLAGESGIRRQPGGFFASALPDELLRPAAQAAGLEANTRFEQMLALSIKDALSRTKVPVNDKRTAFILSTTKGNISLLEQGKAGTAGTSMLLHATAAQVAKIVGAEAQPIVVSNACISGLLAILIAQRLIRAGQFDHAVVCGADELTRFVLSGFQSFQAVSDEPCRPFDAARKGVTLGKAPLRSS